MIDTNNVPTIDDDEVLARFITQSKQFRSDQSVKPDLFIPYRLTELSVTRHRDATTEELWQFGRDVAALRKQTLYGRTDIVSANCKVGPLSVVPDPILPPDKPFNPNHANIIGFPAAKDDQKALALKLAQNASTRIVPPA